ncbi:hypothetical protein BJY16_003386 [Actinoplanes octamycinicus]|uniref:ATP-grasp domain-containing protein n=1 Tax=Actinoplanes octamycinicus TaxID=135948 RepID=A0A7W7GXH0_9ACTN|nr:hypothetical protein [Actinoplanes octamycinicus]MBB4739927.1 hypothetical protein [Actinoplanes octamycinicus]GIE55113.1 ATP-grasp domain-containing protein [Actinoplanes octamycinicus]
MAAPDARVALVTCAHFPDLWEDDHPLRDALLARGVAVEVLRWDDADADWSRFDLTVIRSPWDYVARHEQFVAWARSVPRLANPGDIIAWNTDKRYLSDLAAAGVPVIPTDFVGPGETWSPPATGEWVVKPTVSAGSQDTARYTFPEQLDQARAHVARLTASGRTAMIQPYLAAVATAGETALLCFPDAAGELSFSHAIRKGPMLRQTGEHTIDVGSEEITPRTPSEAELEVARQVLAAVPGGAKRLLYARVDVIPGADGKPQMIELELTEPALFLRTAPGAADRLADAILARL